MALPTIGRDLGLELGGLQWVMNAYLLALGALIITGGSLGDLYGRRKVFNYGLVGFAATSFLCAVAPGGEALIGARVLQGVSAALLIPTSLAIVEASFAEEDRGVAIGAWAGWSGISSAIGPFLGGWLVDVGSWRLVFGVVVVVAVVAAWLGVRHLPESRGPQAHGARPDWIGSALVSLGLAGITHGLVEAGGRGLDDPAVAATDSSLRQRSCGRQALRTRPASLSSRATSRRPEPAGPLRRRSDIVLAKRWICVPPVVGSPQWGLSRSEMRLLPMDECPSGCQL